MTISKSPDPEWLTPAEVCAMFRVGPRALSRWRKTGKIPASEIVPTPGGHFRYRAAYIRGLLSGTQDGGAS